MTVRWIAYSTAAGDSRENVDGRRLDINSRAKVGIPVPIVASGANGRLGSRRVEPGIVAFITCSDGHKVSPLGKHANSHVESFVSFGYACRHVDDDSVGAVAMGCVPCDVVQAGYQSRYAAGVWPLGKGLDAVDGHTLCHAVAVAAEDAGNVRAVADQVLAMPVHR